MIIVWIYGICGGFTGWTYHVHLPFLPRLRGEPHQVPHSQTHRPVLPQPCPRVLKSRILSGVPGGNSLTRFASPDFKVLPFKKGRPLATSGEDEAAGPRWRLRWMGLDECVRFLGELSDDKFVYLGWRDQDNDDGVVYWAIDVSEGNDGIGNVKEEGWCFVELRTLMVATDWDDQSAMGELAIVGHVSVRVRVNGLILGKKFNSVDQYSTCGGLDGQVLQCVQKMDGDLSLKENVVLVFSDTAIVYCTRLAIVEISFFL